MKRLIDKLHQEQMLTAEEFHRLLANRSEETDQYARGAGKSGPAGSVRK